MKTVNEQKLKTLQLSPIDYIVSQWKDILKDEKDKALVCVLNHERTGGNGYLLGLATRNENGYQSLNMLLEENNFDIANEWVNKANQEIFNRDAKETTMIVLSSLRG